MQASRVLLLVAVTVLAAALRFWGLYWAAPERIDLHPDEVDHVMSHALSISVSDPDPKFLNYPSFLMYSIALINGVLRRAGRIHADWQSYVLGRAIVATFGAATAPVTFWLAEAVGATTGGAALAALWLALLPLHVWESHIAVTDVVMTFWIMVALLLSIRLMRRDRGRDYVLAGGAIGLAVASKYTAALVGIAPIVALAVSRRSVRESVRGLLLVASTAVATCVLATPYSFYHLGELRRAMAYEYSHVHGHHIGFSLPAAGPQYHKYVYEIVAAWPFSMGFALYASTVVGVVCGLVRLRKETMVLLAFGVPFFAVTGSWTFTPLRYYLPLLTVGIVFTGLWQGEWLRSEHWLRRGLALATVVVTLGYTTVFTVQTTARYRDDTRMQAARWLRETLSPGTHVLLCGWHRYLGTVADPKIQIVARNEIVVGQLEHYRDFDLLEITSLHYLRWYRHGHPALHGAYEDLRSERNGFHLVKRFEADFLNRDLYRRLDPMFESYFVSPTLEFYAPSATM